MVSKKRNRKDIFIGILYIIATILLHKLDKSNNSKSIIFIKLISPLLGIFAIYWLINDISKEDYYLIKIVEGVLVILFILLFIGSLPEFWNTFKSILF